VASMEKRKPWGGATVADSGSGFGGWRWGRKKGTHVRKREYAVMAGMVIANR
jgi:hypothetical protein